MALRFEDARYGAERSRRLLFTTIMALGEHADAMTVVGAHAVHVWVQQKWGPIDMESTRDGDLAVNPVLIAEDPKIMELLAEKRRGSCGSPRRKCTQGVGVAGGSSEAP